MKLSRMKNANFITPAQMKDGQIGIIRKLDGNSKHIGTIVQRYNKSLISLGKPSDRVWDALCADDDFLIEILPSGTLLEIE